MTDLNSSLIVNDLQFEIRRSDRRRTIGITVDRSGDLIVHAPATASLVDIEAVARNKQLWVHTKLAEKQLLAQNYRPKEYVAGEGFCYLGRSYRLRLVDPASVTSPLRLYQGRFELRRDTTDRGREHFVRWYRCHAEIWLAGRVAPWAERIGVDPSSVVVRDLANRWGSCTANARLNFHWRAILLPVPIVEYVIAHELVHLDERLHSPAFWQRLEQAMPDYETRKSWLALHGARFDL